MRLYLVRHAEANPAEIDPFRGLTERGRADVERVARILEGRVADVNLIYHSGKARSYETASILASHVKPRKGPVETDGLAPNDDPVIWKERLGFRSEDLVLVGHLPHLARLAGLILSGDPGREVIMFRSAAVACLRREEGLWGVEWMVTPDIVP